MKYNVNGFDQEACIEHGIDCQDTFILRLFIDLWNSSKIKKISNNGKEYGWIKYGYIAESFPLMNVKSEAIRKRFKKYRENGILEHYHCLDGGSYSCFRFVPEVYDRLVFSEDNLLKKINTRENNTDPSVNNSRPPRENNTDPSVNNSRPKDSSVKDSSVTNTSIIDIDRDASEIMFYLNSKCSKHYNTYPGKISTAYVRLIRARVNEGYKLGDFKKVIDNMSSKWLEDQKMNRYLRPLTLFSQSHFEDYLQESTIPEKKEDGIPEDYKSYNGLEMVNFE